MGMEIIDFKATKCKHCYKCVRYCGVKAIQVKDERAVIMPDKCILCGHCLRRSVLSQPKPLRAT